VPEPLVEAAPAKVNLTLRVLGRRADGYHELESLVVFAGCGDTLRFAPGGELALTVQGPGAALAGDNADNLVLKAARALEARSPGIRLGTFDLDKQLPVAAGLGGGSADAAAALRLIARANSLAIGAPRFQEAARTTGSDVPVCLDPRPRVMRGIGDLLSEPVALPPMPAILVNPGVPVPTKDVFANWQPQATPVPLDQAVLATLKSRDLLLEFLALQANDLETPAIAVAPVIAEVLAALRNLPSCALARMSGSGATCFALFKTAGDAMIAAGMLHRRYPQWWVQATAFGGAR
jgi:4-diphosphocytidyl-2-C-methyl-D-erythritol kinase